MAGCDKAGRNKKSPHNAAYVAGKRWIVNQDKRIKRHNSQVEEDKNKILSVPHGSARAARREKAMKLAVVSVADGKVTAKNGREINFPKVWSDFRERELKELAKAKEAETKNSLLS